MKKILSLLIAFIMLLTLPAGATVNYEVTDVQNDLVRIYGDAIAEKPVTVIILSDGYVWEELAASDARDSLIYYYDVIMANNSGKYSLDNIHMPHTGTYHIYIHGDGNEEKTVEHISMSGRYEAIARFNLDKSESNAKELVRVLELSSNILVTENPDSYHKGVMLLPDLDPANIDSARVAVQNGLIVSAFNSGKGDILFSGSYEFTYAEKLGLVDSSGAKTSQYANYLRTDVAAGTSDADLEPSALGKAAIKSAVLSYGSYTDFASIKTNFEKEYYLNAIMKNSKMGYGHVHTILDTYRDELVALGVSASKIPSSEDEAFSYALFTSGVTTFDAMKSFINNYAPSGNTGTNVPPSGSTNDTSNLNSSSGLVSGGGFGGGGGGASGGTTIPSAPSGGSSYSDLSSSHWASEAFAALSKTGVIGGYTDGTVKPEKEITRAEYAKMLVTLLGLDISDSSVIFADVPPSHWAAAVIAAASKAGFITGNNGSFNPDDIITRQDAAIILARAAKLSSTNETTFIDNDSISDYARNAAAAVQEAGLMNGTGDGRFAPDEGVAYTALIKTLVSFLEYDIVAETKGGYPTGYMVVASQLDIEAESPADENALTWQEADDIFVNAANVDMALYLNEELSVLRGKSYLSEYRDIQMASGIVTADNFSDIQNDKSPYYCVIKINYVDFYVLESAADIINYGGHNVNILYRKNGGKNEVVYFQLLDTNIIKIDGADVADTTTPGVIRYYDGARERTAKYDTLNTQILYNGSRVSSPSTATLNPFATREGSLTLVDTDNNSIMDIIYVSAFEFMVVGNMKNGFVYSKFADGTTPIDLEGLNEGTLVNIMGDPVNPDSISENDILSYEKDLSGKVTKVIVTIDVGAGIVESITHDSNGEIAKAVISGIEYTFSGYVKNNPDKANIRIGTNLTLYFGANGTVVNFAIQPRSDFKAGVLVDFGVASGLDAHKYIRIYDENDEFGEYKLADKVRVYHTDNQTADLIEAKDLIDIETDAPGTGRRIFGITSDNKVERQLIRYRLTEDNTVSEIIVAKGAGLYTIAPFDTRKVSEFTSTKDAYYKNYMKSMGHFDLRVYVSGVTKVFRIPDDDNRDDDSRYTSSTGNYFSTTTGPHGPIAYATDADSPFMEYAICVEFVSANTSGHNSLNAIVVESVVKTVDAEGYDTTKLIGYNYVDQNEGKLKRQELMLAQECEQNHTTEIETGDVIGYTLNSQGKIVQTYKFLDYSQWDFGVAKRHYSASVNRVGDYKLPNPYFAGGSFSGSGPSVSYTNGADFTSGLS